MLKILNDLEPFFKDSYRRIGVREYAKIRKISPPTASTTLAALQKEGLLNREEERNYHLFSANVNNRLFLQLSQAYYSQHLKEAGLVDYLQKDLINPVIILFGSFAKAEINQNSDIDIAIFTSSQREISLETYDKKLGRHIQLFIFKNKESVKNKDLLNNIHNGVIVAGEWHHGL